MIEDIIYGFLGILMKLIDFLLTPIDLIILNLLPNLSHAFTSIAEFLNVVGQGIGWAISLSGLSSTALALIIAYFVFKLSAPILFWTFKLALKWYNALKF